MKNGLWDQPLYQETIGVVFAFLFCVSLFLFFFRKKSPRFQAAWASLKSWLFAAPILFVVFGLPQPWPLAFLSFVSIFAAKTFFKMVGMYHRTWFVWMCYLFCAVSGVVVHYRMYDLYNVMPMIFLGAMSAIPLLRNSATHMIQYIALSLMAFLLFGWSFLHMGKLLNLEKGIYMIIYVYLLAEFCEAVSLAVSKSFGKVKLFTRITSRVTLEGGVIATILTLVLAWGMRHMLQHREEEYWMAAGLVASFFGRSGDLFLSVIRRDLGIKPAGVFIIGRDDILARVDKLLFVAPIFYYVLYFLDRW